MLTIKSSVFLKKFQRFFSVLETACQAGHAAPPSPYPQQWVYLPPIQRLAAGGDFTLKVSVSICRLRRPENAVPTAGAKGGKGTVWFPCPLLTPPQTLLCAATPFGRAAKRELRGLGSGRRFAYGTLLCPEFTLRYPPRITVRGHSVQGANAVAATARQGAGMSQTQKEHRFASVLFRVM